MNNIEIKTIWPEWEIDEAIGEGASGKVYRAKRTDSKGVYSAIKVIEIPQNQSEVEEARSEGLDDVSIKQYFKSFVDELIREISLLENLKSAQNIVGIEDYKVIEKNDKIGYIIYIRMELLTSVNSYFSQNALEEKDIVKLGIDLCRALEYCEKLKIIHRDIKPENIFVSRFGEFKLGDFGIARKLENTSSIMSKKGTYIYMAPEVYKGNSYDKTVDIYSLGLVMYRFCNSNRTPFLPEYPQAITYKDKENALYRRMDGEKIPKPAKMSQELYKIISKMCEYEPQNRYINISDVKKDLENLQNSDIYNEESEITQSGTVNIFSQAIKAKKMEEIKQKSSISKTKNSLENQKQAETLQKMKEEQQTNRLKSDANKLNNKKNDKNEIENKANFSNNNTINFTDKGNIKLKKEPKSSETKINPKKLENQNKKIIIAIIIILLLILMFVLFKIFAKNKESKPIEIVNKLTVPNVTLMQIEDAKQALSELELDLQIEEIYQEGVENGVVIYQSLEENTQVEKGDKLVLLVNNLDKKQIEKVIIPNVVGKTIDEASTILAELGLMVEKIEEYNNDVESNIVTNQNIEENSEVEKGSIINLVVSLGKENKDKDQPISLQQNKNNTNNNQSDNQNNNFNQQNNNQQNNNQQNNNQQNNNQQQPQSTQQLQPTQLNTQTTTSTWSDWIESLPSGVNSSNYNIETKTQYSYRTKETTTSTNSSLAGWTNNGAVETYSAWSAPQTTSTKPAETDCLHITETKVTERIYYHWCNEGKSGENQWRSWVGDYSALDGNYYTFSKKHTIKTSENWGNSTQSGPACQSKETHNNAACNSCKWYYEGDSQKTYTYVTRSKITNYSYYKWSDWSAYSDTSVSKNDNTEVKTRTLYRYKAN